MNKIFFYLLAIGMLAFCPSCKKEGSTVNKENSTVKKETDQDKLIENAKSAVRQIKDIDDNTLDWSTAKINKPALPESALEIKVWSRKGDVTFTYFETGGMKMYQWKGEVHLVPNVISLSSGNGQ